MNNEVKCKCKCHGELDEPVPEWKQIIQLKEEIAAVKAENERLREHNEQLRKNAILLPEFPQDMLNILEPLKVQSALNSELMKLEYRKEHKPKDVSILDYTIIAALYRILQQSEAELSK